jgi:hypothetical protein
MNTNDNISDLLRRIERLLRTYPHLHPWVLKMVEGVEQQAWAKK